MSKINRTCLLCMNVAIEDVQHFVAVCPYLKPERDECLRRIDAGLSSSVVPTLPPRLVEALRVRSDDCLTQLFVGDLFHGLPKALYDSLHGTVLNYLMLIWKKRSPVWARFCRDGDEWSLIGSEPDG